MPDLLEKQRSDIERRLAELRPVLDEYRRLEEADKALAGLTARGPKTVGRKPGRPPGGKARRKRAAGRRGGRPAGSGNRAAEAHQIIRGQPGITIPEIASKMGIAPNYLYRVLPILQKERKITKTGKGWHTTS